MTAPCALWGGSGFLAGSTSRPVTEFVDTLTVLTQDESTPVEDPRPWRVL